MSFAQSKNDLEQIFTDITFLDGSRRVRAENSNYESRSSSGVDDLTTRTLSLSACYDFSIAGSRFTPSVGAGVGVSFLKLSGLYFQSWYSCKNPASGCDMPEWYNVRQHENLSDTVFSTHLHAGLDYRVSGKMLLGFKFSCSMASDMKDVKGNYDSHPASGISSFTTPSGMNHFSLMFGVKYFFGE